VKEEINSADEGQYSFTKSLHIHLCLCKLVYDVLALLSRPRVMYTD